MFYRFSVLTDENTSEENQVKTILPLARGVVHQVDFRFPPGPQALLHVRLKRGLHQVWPSNSEEAFASDNERISFREHFELFDLPYQLELYSWNDDESYPHLIIVRIGILPRKIILRRLF